MPAFLPCKTDWVKTKILSGPGVMASVAEVNKKIIIALAIIVSRINPVALSSY
jgi:hypothetical protein